MILISDTISMGGVKNKFFQVKILIWLVMSDDQQFCNNLDNSVKCFPSLIEIFRIKLKTNFKKMDFLKKENGLFLPLLVNNPY